MGSYQDLLTPKEWQRAVERRIQTSDFQLLGCKVRPLGEDGRGFLGDHFLAEVTVQLTKPSSTTVLNFFFKTMPQSRDYQRLILEASGSFKKEVEVVSILFEDMRAALKNGGKGMEWTCVCFYARSDLILLEDLSVQGFSLVDTKTPLQYQHCAVVLKALANLHAASIIFEETHKKQPFRIGVEYADTMKESFFRNDPDNPDHPGAPWLKTCASAFGALVEESRGSEAFQKVKSELDEAFNALFEFEKPSTKFRNVVNQGDMWGNNIFFRLDGKDPVEARLVDFQLARYTPPANDIMCFLHLTTTKAFRDQCESQLLKVYHAHLSQNLRNHDLDPDELLPWNKFKESCDYYKTCGIVKSGCYCTVVYLKEEHLSDVFVSSESFEKFLMSDRNDVVKLSYRNDPTFRERVTAIVDEIIEECIIHKGYLKVSS